MATLLKVKTDYAGGTPPGTGTNGSAADWNVKGNALDLYARVFGAAAGSGILPWPDANSFLVTAGAGLTANVAAGMGSVYVSALNGATGHVPIVTDSTTTTLDASKTDWYLFANVTLSATEGVLDSRDDGRVTFTTNSSPTPANGQILLAQFTTGVSSITRIIDLRPMLRNSKQWTKEPVRAAATANVTVSNPGTAVFDGVTLAAGERVGLYFQTAGTENGEYIFRTSATALVRAADADSSSDFLNSQMTPIAEGTLLAGAVALLKTANPITLGVTSLSYEILKNPTTTLGDFVYAGANGVPTRLAGNTTTTRKFLSQTGDGVGNSAAPTLVQPASTDLSDFSTAAQSQFNTWVDTILTDADGNVLVSGDGYVLTS